MSYSRRAFFSEFSRSMLRQVLPERAMAVEQPEPIGAGGWVRPPGALPEQQFRVRCTLCTDCQRACPEQSIRRLGPEFGDIAGTPVVIPTESPCYLCAEMPCIAACTEGALVPVAVRQVRMGTAVLAASRCYLAMGQPCDYCVVRCPLKSEAIAFRSTGPPVIDEDACVGCGVCAYLCPAEAITIVPSSA